MILLVAAWAGSLDGRDREARELPNLYTDDLPRFYEAFDSPDRRRAFSKYKRHGTPGLKAMFRLRIGSPKELLTTVEAMESYYSTARGTILSIHSDPHLRSEMQAGIARASAEIDSPVNLPIYVVVGRGTAGGTLSKKGLYIGAEFYGRGEGVELEELRPWLRSILQEPDQIPNIVVHEWVHAQQAECSTDTLLAKSISEGVADFLADRHAPADPKAYVVWATPREAVVWSEFSAVMASASSKGWLYSGTDDRPADVGYFMGSRIASAWWDLHPELTVQARTAELLRAHCRAPEFLQESGYAP